MATAQKLAPAAKRPVHEVRIGRVKAAIWENESSQGVFYNATFQRIFRDEQGDWKSSDSFSRDDLLVLRKVADAVHTWIYEQGQENG